MTSLYNKTCLNYHKITKIILAKIGVRKFFRFFVVTHKLFSVIYKNRKHFKNGLLKVLKI